MCQVKFDIPKNRKKQIFGKLLYIIRKKSKKFKKQLKNDIVCIAKIVRLISKNGGKRESLLTIIYRYGKIILQEKT